jgi:hypothetical protein
MKFDLILLLACIVLLGIVGVLFVLLSQANHSLAVCRDFLGLLN